MQVMSNRLRTQKEVVTSPALDCLHSANLHAVFNIMFPWRVYKQTTTFERLRRGSYIVLRQQYRLRQVCKAWKKFFRHELHKLPAYGSVVNDMVGVYHSAYKQALREQFNAVNKDSVLALEFDQRYIDVNPLLCENLQELQFHLGARKGYWSNDHVFMMFLQSDFATRVSKVKVLCSDVMSMGMAKSYRRFATHLHLNFNVMTLPILDLDKDNVFTASPFERVIELSLEGMLIPNFFDVCQHFPLLRKLVMVNVFVESKQEKEGLQWLYDRKVALTVLFSSDILETSFYSTPSKQRRMRAERLQRGVRFFHGDGWTCEVYKQHAQLNVIKDNKLDHFA